MSLDFLMDGEKPQDVVKDDIEVDDEFKILSAKDQIKRRPNMWIGSVTNEEHDVWIGGQYVRIPFVAGLIKCANEIIDNSVDEGIRTEFKFANKINITVKDNMFTVEDNGRGIPQDKILFEGEKYLRPVAAWTMVNSSSNYGENRKTGGMNGVGSSLANYFSSLFIGETGNGKSMVVVNCTDGCNNIAVATKPTKWRGTKVTFIPDFNRFDCDGVDENTIKVLEERVQTLAISYPEIEFKFNGKKMDSKFKKHADQYSENGITVENEGFSVFYTTNDQGFRHNSFVNGLGTKDGGVHVNTFFEKLADEIIPMVKRQYKLDINRARVKECSTLVLFLRGFNNPQFDSQTKVKLTNTVGEFNQHVGDIDYTKLARRIVKTESLIMPIIESALARKLAAEKAAATKAAKQAKKARVAKHVKANGLDKPDVKTTLFLTEGDSAIGYLLKVRDPDTQGGFPLRGRPLNSWNESEATILKNKEMFEIMSILNLSFGDKGENMTYDQIAIMPDADVDGTGGIYPSLIAFFYKHWPEIIEQEKLLFAKSPQMISTGPKGKIDWSYDLEEWKSKKFVGKWDHRHIKGLGSLTEEEYARVIQNPVFEIVVADDKATEKFEMLYGDDSEPRKVWMMS